MEKAVLFMGLSVGQDLKDVNNPIDLEAGEPKFIVYKQFDGTKAQIEQVKADLLAGLMTGGIEVKEKLFPAEDRSDKAYTQRIPDGEDIGKYLTNLKNKMNNMKFPLVVRIESEDA